MRLEELSALCREAARDLAGRQARPLPPAVVLPRPEASRIVTMPELPADDDTRRLVMERFAEDEMRPVGAPAYGFVAEGELSVGEQPVDVVMVVYGARRQGAWVSAAPLGDEGLGEFAEDEPLDPRAMPFLEPLQRAADEAGPPDVTAVR